MKKTITTLLVFLICSLFSFARSQILVDRYYEKLAWRFYCEFVEIDETERSVIYWKLEASYGVITFYPSRAEYYCFPFEDKAAAQYFCQEYVQIVSNLKDTDLELNISDCAKEVSNLVSSRLYQSTMVYEDYFAKDGCRIRSVD